MSQICIKTLDKGWKTLAVSRGEDEVNLVYSGIYQEGDRITVEIDEKDTFYWMQLDDALGHSLVYLKDSYTYEIPFAEKRINISPKAFFGKKHLLHIRKARDFEYMAYRNLAFNVNDRQGNTKCFPHASANVETRGESVFAAVNAIDGVTATGSHGEWPYGSWGINQQADAAMKLDFGRVVEIDRIIVYLRADYPHDNWWKRISAVFSDGSTLEMHTKKTGDGQEFAFEKKQVEWLELGKLVKAEGASPFPALTQLEIYGNELSNPHT